MLDKSTGLKSRSHSRQALLTATGKNTLHFYSYSRPLSLRFAWKINYLHGVVDEGSKAVLHVRLQNISVDGIVLGDLVIAVKCCRCLFDINFLPSEHNRAERTQIFIYAFLLFHSAALPNDHGFIFLMI